MTVADLLNTFVTQVNACYDEEAMEKKATSDDLTTFLSILAILSMAMRDSGN